jgi:hypothetical protein
MEVLIGVDPHKATNVVAAVDEQGGLVGQENFPANCKGMRALERWANGFPERRWAVEGASRAFRRRFRRKICTPSSRSQAATGARCPRRARRPTASDSPCPRPLSFALPIIQEVQSSSAEPHPKAGRGYGGVIPSEVLYDNWCGAPHSGL